MLDVGLRRAFLVSHESIAERDAWYKDLLARFRAHYSGEPPEHGGVIRRPAIEVVEHLSTPGGAVVSWLDITEDSVQPLLDEELEHLTPADPADEQIVIDRVIEFGALFPDSDRGGFDRLRVVINREGAKAILADRRLVNDEGFIRVAREPEDIGLDYVAGYEDGGLFHEGPCEGEVFLEMVEALIDGSTLSIQAGLAHGDPSLLEAEAIGIDDIRDALLVIDPDHATK